MHLLCLLRQVGSLRTKVPQLFHLFQPYFELIMLWHKLGKSNFCRSCQQNPPQSFLIVILWFSVLQTVSWSCGTSTNLTVFAPSRVTSMRRTLLAWLPMETMLPVVRIDFEKAHCDNVANESVTQNWFHIFSAKQSLLLYSSLQAVIIVPRSV